MRRYGGSRPAWTSAWKVGHIVRERNHVLSALMSTSSGGVLVMPLTAFKSVRPTPSKDSIVKTLRHRVQLSVILQIVVY